MGYIVANIKMDAMKLTGPKSFVATCERGHRKQKTYTLKGCPHCTHRSQATR